jgi:hypothetical protein
MHGQNDLYYISLAYGISITLLTIYQIWLLIDNSRLQKIYQQLKVKGY